MRILMISDDYLPNIGGMANHVHNLAHALSNLGHWVAVSTLSITPYDDLPSLRNLVPQWRNEHDYPVLRFPLLELPKRRGWYWQLRNLYARYLRRTIRDKGVEVVHWHGYVYDHYVVQHLNSAARVFTNHSSMFLNALNYNDNLPSLRSRVSPADWVIAPSQELVQATIKVGYPSNRITYIPNGVDCELFSPATAATKRRLRAELHLPADATVILCARRFVEKNGVEYFVEAIPNILEQTPKDKILFVFAGNSATTTYPYALRLINKLEDYRRQGLPVHLLGKVPYKEMPRIMRVADVAVMPSLIEATSLSALEAMASGLAVVATRVGGLPELVTDGVTGCLVPPGDVEGITTALVSLVKNPSFRAEIGEAARQTVLSKFTWNHVAEQTLRVYAQALRRSTTVPR